MGRKRIELTTAKKNQILAAFVNQHNNTVGSIVEATGVSKALVNRVINEHLAKRSVGGKHVFMESRYTDVALARTAIRENHPRATALKNLNWWYYIEAVMSWSERNPRIKRDDRGWLATIRNWINKDLAAGKPVRQVEESPTTKFQNF